MTPKLKQSPFMAHRDKVLGHYGTASFLRAVVLALWNGTDYKVGLSRINSLDQEHYTALMEMITQYRHAGESDPAFMALADDVRARVAEEKRAAERAEAFESWCDDIKSIIRDKNVNVRAGDIVDDHYDWLDSQFGSITAEHAADELVRRHQAAR